MSMTNSEIKCSGTYKVLKETVTQWLYSQSYCFATITVEMGLFDLYKNSRSGDLQAPEDGTTSSSSYVKDPQLRDCQPTASPFSR